MLRNVQEWALLLIIFGVMTLAGNWLNYDIMPLQAIPGMLVLIAIALLGLIIQKALPIDLPTVAYVAIIGILASMPWMPGSAQIVEWTSQVELLATTTPILAYAGISIGRSWTDFAKLGWRTLIVASFVLLGTFLGSAIIAEIILRMQGII